MENTGEDSREGPGIIPGEIIVTASRRETARVKVPVKAGVINREEIERSPARPVDELMKNIPGISHKRTHFSECGPGREVTLRGISEQKRTLVLVDGIPANAGGHVNWSLIPAGMVERVEVVPGPMSALYGSGAMGGVINIMTRKPAQKSETGIHAGYGSLNSRSLFARQAGRSGQWGYTMAGRRYETDGYTSVIDEQAYHSDTERTEHNFLGNFIFFPTERSSLTAGLSVVEEKYNRGVQTDDQENQKAVAHLTYERKMDREYGLTAALYTDVSSLEVDLGARPDYTRRDHVEDTDNFRAGQLLKASIPLTDTHVLTAGIDTSYSRMDKEDRYDRSDRKGLARGKQAQVSLFAQDEMAFDLGADQFSVTLGMRGDYIRIYDGVSSDTAPGHFDPVDETHGNHSWFSLSPKVGLVYALEDRTVFRLSAGKSFAAATLFESYAIFTRGPLLLYGNPDLDPEKAYTVEIGVDQRVTDSLLARIAAYHTRGHDFIGLRTTAPMIRKYDNISEISVFGLDVDFEWKIDAGWRLNGWYKYNLSEVDKDEADPAAEGNLLPFEPEHRAKIGVACHLFDPIVVEVGLRYEGHRYTDLKNTGEDALDEYVTLDLSVSGRVGEHLKWTLSGENLLDRTYDVYGIPTEKSEAPGILVNLSLSYHF